MTMQPHRVGKTYKLILGLLSRRFIALISLLEHMLLVDVDQLVELILLSLCPANKFSTSRRNKKHA